MKILRRATLVTGIACLLLGLIGGWIAHSFSLPQYPSYWDTIGIDMPRAEAREAIPMLRRSAKPELIDEVVIDYGDRYWLLRLYYDKDNKVEQIEKKYVDRRLGWVNRTQLESRQST